MGITEIVLLVIGGLFFVISFFLPEGKKEEKITQEEIKALVDKEIENAKGKIDDMVDETVTYAVEKTERQIEKIANEKILAVDEYSETVLKRINDNHQEAVFLYDMLNDKDEKLKTSKDEISAGIEMVENAKKEIEVTKQEIAKEKELLDLKIEEVAAQDSTVDEKAEETSFEPFKVENLEVVKVEGDKIVEEPAEEPKPRKRSTRAKTSENTKTGAKAKKPATVPVHLETANDGRRNSNELIRKLHEEGKSNTQIARELNLGVGEVKLVIDLFANRK